MPNTVGPYPASRYNVGAENHHVRLFSPLGLFAISTGQILSPTLVASTIANQNGQPFVFRHRTTVADVALMIWWLWLGRWLIWARSSSWCTIIKRLGLAIRLSRHWPCRSAIFTDLDLRPIVGAVGKDRVVLKEPAIALNKEVYLIGSRGSMTMTATSNL
jgi:hypothetical protein